VDDMTIRASSSTSVNLPVGGLWKIGVCATDSDGVALVDPPVVTVTIPGGSTATPIAVQGPGSVWAAEYVLSAAGRHTARVTTGLYGAVDFTAYATAIVAADGMPTLEDLRGADPAREDPDDLGYLGANGATDADIEDALDAEASAQRDAVRVPAAYPASLRQALLRRVARNLAMRGLPLAVLQGDAETGDTTVLPGNDPEVRRLERPHRRLKVG
jgi:hypothetical protein